MSDHSDLFDQARANGTPPASAAKQIGEKYELNSLDPMTMEDRRKPITLFKPDGYQLAA